MKQRRTVRVPSRTEAHIYHYREVIEHDLFPACVRPVRLPVRCR